MFEKEAVKKKDRDCLQFLGVEILGYIYNKLEEIHTMTDFIEYFFMKAGGLAFADFKIMKDLQDYTS